MDDFFSIDGRLNRGAYFLQNMGISATITVGVIAASYYLNDPGNPYMGVMPILEEYGLYIGAAALFLWFFPTAKRCHDLNWSAWLYLINLIPIIGIILEIILLCRRGARGPNQYGPDPLGHLNTSTENQAIESPSAGTHFSTRSPAAVSRKRTSGRQSPEIRSADLAAATVMLEEIKAHYQAEIDDLREKHNLAIKTLRQKHESELNRTHESKVDSSFRLSTKIDHLNGLIAEKDREIEEASRRIHALQNRLIFFRAIANLILAVWSGIQRMFAQIGRLLGCTCNTVLKAISRFHLPVWQFIQRITAKVSRATRNGCAYILNDCHKSTKPLSAKYACPHCDQHIEIESDFVGSQIECPACSKVFIPGK